MTTYYVQGIHYGDLTDLLSDGWPEDQVVQVHTGTAPESSTIAQLREQFQIPAVYAKLHRVVAVANEGFAERTPTGGYQYASALITEDEPGWVPRHWYRTLVEAKAAAAAFNTASGHSRDTVLEVQVSSMRAGRVR